MKMKGKEKRKKDYEALMQEILCSLIRYDEKLLKWLRHESRLGREGKPNAKDAFVSLKTP